MFTAVLFTLARTWKQPKCPSTGEWIKMYYIYTVEYYSAISRSSIWSFLTFIDSFLNFVANKVDSLVAINVQTGPICHTQQL